MDLQKQVSFPVDESWFHQLQQSLFKLQFFTLQKWLQCFTSPHKTRHHKQGKSIIWCLSGLIESLIKVTCRSKHGVFVAGTWVTGHQLHPHKVGSAWLKVSCRQVHRRDSSASIIAFSFSKLWSESYKSCNFQRFLILLSFMRFPDLLSFVSWVLWVSHLLPRWNVWILRKPLHDTHDKILPVYVF